MRLARLSSVIEGRSGDTMEQIRQCECHRKCLGKADVGRHLAESQRDGLAIRHGRNRRELQEFQVSGPPTSITNLWRTRSTVHNWTPRRGGPWMRSEVSRTKRLNRSRMKHKPIRCSRTHLIQRPSQLKEQKRPSELRCAHVRGWPPARTVKREQAAFQLTTVDGLAESPFFQIIFS